MNTERLLEFTILANTLNFSRTAQKLYISQSVLSRHIREMEKELGVLLFTRSTHGVFLTDAGHVLLRSAEPLIQKTEEAASLLHNFKTDVKGSVHIAFSDQTLCTSIQDFLRQFCEKYPDIFLQLEPISDGTSQESLYHYDFYFSPCEFVCDTTSGIRKNYLMSQNAILAIPPFHPLGEHSLVALDELKDETLLVPFSNELFGPYAQNALLADKQNAGKLTRIGVASAQAALLMVNLGQGIAIIPHHLKHQVYRNTRTISILNPECKFDIFLYYNSHANNPVADLFYESALNFFEKSANGNNMHLPSQ
jgi:DNA-binding transcriptional LysR family regulator